ncbi:MFS transporter [Pseudonocardia sp. EC080625-04]|uniref:MFS transporter n=1 Tax=Pseudonocardia sp. EC080625-04 TaxID=1096868 RepID=UPI0009EAA6A8|nr:MFS transporter [Pseudonocardia sp. EC080625-04]
MGELPLHPAVSATPVVRLWLAVLAGYLALGATIQAIPGYVTDDLGAGTFGSGLAVGIAFLATAAVRPIAGLLADTRDPRPVVMLGGILTAAGGFGHLVAPNLALLLVARLVMGAGEAALFSAALPWVLRRTPPERSGRVAGWFGLSMWGGLAIGPLVASLTVPTGGYTAVWLLVSGLGLLSAVLVSTTLAQDREPVTQTRPLRQLLGIRTLVPHAAVAPGIAFGLSSFGYGTIAAMVVLFLSEAEVAAAGYALAVFAIVFLIVRAVGSPMVDRFGGARIGQIAVAGEVIGLVALALLPPSNLSVLGVAVVGAGVALTYPATVSMTVRRAKSMNLGTSVGVMISFWDLGIMVAGPIAGLVAVLLGFPAAFLIAALLGVGSIAVIQFGVRRPESMATAAHGARE